MLSPIRITDMQFGSAYEGAKERRLVEDLQRTQRLVNELVKLVNDQQTTITDLIARVTVLEGP